MCSAVGKGNQEAAPRVVSGDFFLALPSEADLQQPLFYSLPLPRESGQPSGSGKVIKSFLLCTLVDLLTHSLGSPQRRSPDKCRSECGKEGGAAPRC